MHTLKMGKGTATFTFTGSLDKASAARDHMSADLAKRGRAHTLDGPRTLTILTDIPAKRPAGPRFRADGKLIP